MMFTADEMRSADLERGSVGRAAPGVLGAPGAAEDSDAWARSAPIALPCVVSLLSYHFLFGVVVPDDPLELASYDWERTGS